MDARVKLAEDVQTRREGPKRSAASKRAIFEAARSELAEGGWRQFSADRLSRRARASKQTIYRWWPSLAALAVEATLDLIEPPRVGPGVELDVQLTRFLEPLSELARKGDGAHLLRSGLLAAADDAAAGEVYRKWFNGVFRAPLKAVLAEAAMRGKIRKDWDIDVACELLFGPVWHRVVILRGPLPEAVTKRAANSLMQALRP